MDNVIDVGLVLYLCKRIGNRHPCTDRALESETFEVTGSLKKQVFVAVFLACKGKESKPPPIARVRNI
jgi:hypothetical protein